MSTRLKVAIKHKKHSESRLTRGLSRQVLDTRARLQRERNKKPENKIKQRAYNIVRYALKKGIISKGPCACGRTDVHAHHDNYAEPLNVRWLCPSCHAKEHKRSPFHGNPIYEAA
jgi:ribosomal protein S27AE